MQTKSKWSPGPGAKVLVVALTDDDSWVVSAAGPAFGICPDCGRLTRNRHGWSNRGLQDLPVQGKTVTVKLRLSRWRCAHQNCERNAIELPWSNGQAEGQINRLKTIKRAMYGRAGTELLRARMLPLINNHHHTNSGRPN
ncbi:transposase family protein [Rhizobium etli]|nr:transposase family protein [Rhizobium etli]